MSVLNLKSQTDMSGFYVIYRGSCMNEKKGIYGISHLMEHLMCKNLDDLMEGLNRDGINWNAYTSGNEIVFYLTGLDDKVDKYRDLLVDRLAEFKITEEILENEKKIVLEEYMDYFNNQAHAHNLNLTRKLFNYYDPIGERSDIENITLKDCESFFNVQYKNPSNIINVSKYVEFEKDIEFNNKNFENTFSYGDYNNVPIESIIESKEKTSLYYLSPLLYDDFDIAHLVCNLLGDGLHSPLYQEIREKRGLVYYVWCYAEQLNKQGIINIATLTSDENVNEVEDIVRNVLNNKEKFITQEMLNNEIESYKIQYRKDEIFRHSNVKDFIFPKEWIIKDKLDSITLDDVYRVCDKYFDFEKYYKSQDKTEF